MSIEESLNKKNKRPEKREAEDLFDDVEIESAELFVDDEGPELEVLDLLDTESSEKAEKREKKPSEGGSKDKGLKLSLGGLGKHSSKKSTMPNELNSASGVLDSKKKKTETDKKRRSRMKKIAICAIVETLTVFVIFAYGYVLRTFNLMSRTEVDLSVVENDNISFEKKQAMEGYWNIAVFGLDASLLNSDVIMIVSINMDTGEIKLVSVFRDTYLNISSSDQYNKINQAYAQGGPEQALAALNKNLDLNITSYVTFNWKTVATIINMLGGVDDIDISNAEFYYINAFITETVNETGIGSVHLTSPGTQHLDGIQAVAYSRLRLMDSDFARTERQKKVIFACFEKIKEMDYSTLNNIMVTCFPEIETNIELSDVVPLAQNLMSFEIGETGGFPWSRGDARIPNKGACVIPTTLESNVKYLHEFLFGEEDYEVSDAVLTYSEKIKQDSSLYKEGTVVESVATDQGVIQTSKTSAASDETTTEAPTAREASTEEYTIGVNEDGELVYPTNEDGDIVIPTDSDGDVIYPTDEDGNEIRGGTSYSTRATRPTDLAEDETEGDAGSEIVDDYGNVLGTSPTRTTTSTTTEDTSATNAAGSSVSTEADDGPGSTTSTTQSTTSVTEIPDEPVTVARPTTVATTAASALSPGSSDTDTVTNVDGPGM